MTNAEFATHQLWSWTRRVFSVPLAALLLLLPVSSYALDTLCAKVKIEITQELTMERQGFDAMMKITNGLTTTSLDSVSVNVNFKDELGNTIRATSDPTDTTAGFFIRIDTMTGIDNVTGTGVVAPATTAEVHWLIVPAPGSGGTVPTGKLYYIGASLSYAIAGKTEQIDVTPDFIYVKPMPLLTLDYFMTKDVWGDDPLTPQIEPVEPYTLGVRVKNNGAATATNVKIDSAQPKIVDNQHGLLINFEIIGSYLNDQPAISSLMIPFGDIAPTTAANGRWIMTSSLAGHFADFSVSFTHDNALGGALTSLMQATNPHYLIRDVKVDMPGRDNIRDFLALDGAVLRVYESSGLDTLVTDQSSFAVLTASGTNANGEALFALSTPATAGPMYVQLPDPYGGTMALGKMTRSDGKTIPAENVWLSKKRDASQVLQYFFNLFDADTIGIYNTAFTSAVAIAHPPVIQLVPDSTVTEGTQLTFSVTSTDPDGTAPLLSTTSVLPVGATFNTAVGANNVVTGTFSWKPSKGQAGKYPITFSSTDGVLKAATSTNITVTTPIVPAGPDMPLIAVPQVGTDVNALTPSLGVAASTNALDTVKSYHIQVFSDAGMQTLVAEKLSLPRVASGNSVWTVPVSLADNTPYYWRVRASDGTTFSSWAVGRFFVNTVNDAPTAPIIASPMDGTTVSVTTPTLSVTNSTDPENDTVVYGFEVFSDSLLTQKVAEVVNLAAGAPALTNGGSTNWTVTPALNNTTLYFWRASATDIHGAKTVSATGNFLVDTTKPAPGAPALVTPAGGSVLTINNVDLTVANSLRPNGMVLNYFFELDRSQTFISTDLIRSGALPEGGVNTVFTATGLVENAHYFWRVKSSDGLTDSPWTYGDFIVDTVNNPPSVPGAINPGDNAWVTTTTPLFTLAPSVDPEGDAIAYHIEVYSDVTLTTKVVDRLTNNLSWLMDTQLADDTRYYWHVRAEDLRGGLSAWSPTSSFLVRTGSSGSMLPSLAVTSPSTVVDVPVVSTASPSVAVTISWEIDDPQGNSHVALFYSSDRVSTSGTRIIDGLPQDPSSRLGNYSWDVSTLSPGTYYVYAIVSNSAGTVTRYAPGAFVVPVPTPRGVITVTPISLLETTKAGGKATFSVVLGNSPKSDVSIGLNTTKPTDGLVDQPLLVFNTANWKTPQTVAVTGQPDCINAGDVNYQVITSKAISSDADYNDVKGADLPLINRGSTAVCPSNIPPVANAGPAQKVDAASTVALNGSGTDADGAVVAYAWLQTAGPAVVLADATKAVTSFTAPSLKVDTPLTFQLTATDNLGATGTANVVITVKAAPNLPPTANAGAAQTVSAGSTVKLTGTGTDSDGTIASYAWTQIAGPQVTLTTANTANAGFVATTVSANTTFGFSLTVTDNLGATGTSTVVITVLPNQPPVANAGVNQTVNESTPVTLTGSGTDSDGTVASYAWTQTGGPTVVFTNPNTAIATFTAPVAAADTVLTFQLTVTDNLGATGTATSTVTVKHVNVPPVANAGANQSVKESVAVTLTGSGTDSDGTIASYAWTQTAGPTVVLNGAATTTASFTAPATAVGIVLTFKLTVTDNLGASSSATTNVAVNHVNVPPTANAGANQSVNESTPVTLTGIGTDTDGTIASYAWTQTAGPTVVLTNANAAVATFTAPAAAVDTVLTFQLIVTDNAGATGTASTNVTVKHVNIPPTVNAGVAQSVNENTVATLNGSATDSDGTIASYAWTQTVGPTVTITNANAATASFIAPAAAVDTVFTFKLTATDNSGASSSATTNVTVKHVNVAPTANAGAAQTVNEGSSVTLAGSGVDTDGTIASYAWVQTAGPTVTLSNANAAVATFIAPAALVNTVLTFQLTVTDNLGATGTATVNVTVQHVNVPPTANAGAAQTVNEKTAVTLTGSGTDTDGTIASYAWVQTAGPAVTLTNANAAVATFTAPAVTASTVLTFQLTVTDNLGATGTATVNVTVQHVNVPPTANAGAAQTVNEKTAVTLTGSGTDTDGTIASYAWVQTAGPAVTLTNANAAVATFTAPATLVNTVLTFQLTVTDNLGATGTATVNVTVQHVNVPPTANAGVAQTVNGGSAVTLAGSGTDSDGTIASYAWKQTAGPTVTLGGATSTTASFTAPTVTTTTVLTFQLTVTDNNGATGTATVNVTVTGSLIPPTVNAGAAQTVTSASKVTLAGSATAGSGTIKSYAWTQTAGPTVTLTGATTATASFTAPTVTTATVLTFTLTVTDSLGSTGSATVNITVNPPTPPTVSAGAAQTVTTASKVTLAGSATAGTGTIKTYAWTQTAGTAVTLAGATTATASFTAPTVTTATVLTFKLTVTDSLGSTGSATVNITVNPPTPPTVNAGAAQTVTTASKVTLAGSATAGTGTIKSYAWTQTAGTAVTLTGATKATATFTAPTVTTTTVLTFTLTVTDSLGSTGTSTVDITVNPPTSPTVSAGIAQTVTTASKVTLAGSATAGTGTIKTYAWTQTAGPTVTLTGAATATASFTAPTVTTATVLTFKLTVTDSLGSTGSATVNVTVNPPTPPTVNAGAAQTVTTAAKVTLAGSATAGTGTLKTYAWTQIAGTAVTLTGATKASATFTAPTVTAATVLTFTLTVTDSLGSTGTSTVNITVNPPTPPTVSAGAAQTVTKGSKVTLAGSATAGTGTLKTYAWKQTAGPTVTLTGATKVTASFTAPTVTTATVLTFSLTVTDSLGSTGTSTVNVTVQ